MRARAPIAGKRKFRIETACGVLAADQDTAHKNRLKSWPDKPKGENDEPVKG
jgi:hypothetical protein